MTMKAKYIFMLLLSLLPLGIAHAQSAGPPGSQVMVVLSASGSDWDGFTYQNSDRVDLITNQITANLQFHPSSPQVNGAFFSSTSADFGGTINIITTAIETESGSSDTDALSNQINYNEPGLAVNTVFLDHRLLARTPAMLRV